ncbi:nucleophile aminohydrolase [Penicillium freii]|nr:nucleophile aminohydrolase [Penicillium freii]
MLMLGGNAADAMVATIFCIGVVAMYHSGIGGGGFMLVRDGTGSFEYIDFRETAPAASSAQMSTGVPKSGFKGLKRYETSGQIHDEPLLMDPSGVPGEVRGLGYLHRKYGSLPWATVMMPAIKNAREGFPVSKDLARYIQLGVGDIMTRKRYASTLESIALNGPDSFYSGHIGQEIIATLQAANGIMTSEDLANYTVAIRNTSQIDYRGYRITSTEAPSSGIVVLNILKVLSTYDRLFTADNVNLTTHRLDEAIKFAYGLRAKLGDPDFVDGMDEYQDFMLDQSTIDHIRHSILDTQTQDPSTYNPEGLEILDTPGTSHIASVDYSGLAVSATTTINLLFGNHLMVPENGIILNNEMDDFSIPSSSRRFGYTPSEANFIQPGKRPFSSMSPAIVTHPNGSLFFIAGAGGGSYITTTTTQNIISAIDEELSASEVLAKPRLHDQLIPNHVTFETIYDNATVDFMRSLGHNIAFVPPIASMAQAIRVLPDGSFDAAGEPRQQDSGGSTV